jgi:hypothetical protein
MTEDGLYATWLERGDDETLRVLADSWAQNGDPRGELVQLSLIAAPNAEQTQRRAAMIKKLGGALIGPARPYLREWEFGARGIVEVARCESGKLVEGIAVLSRVNPRLCLCVTSLKTRAQAAAFAKISLAPFYFVGFTSGLIGAMGGSPLADNTLVTIAPAFRGLKRFSLQARGWAGDSFTPDGLTKFAAQLDGGVELVVIDHWTSPDRTPLPPVERYVEVLQSHRAFAGATIETDCRKLRAHLYSGPTRK